MRRHFPLTVLPLLVCGALAATASGGCTGPAESAPEHTGSVQALVTEAGRGWHQDYEPLASPRDAVGRADLIVTGVLTGVGQGITMDREHGSATQYDAEYVTLEVRVDRVLSDKDRGRSGAGTAGTVIHVVMNKSVTATTERLAELNPRARMVLVLADRTTWQPTSGVDVVRPAGIPAGAPLFAAYNDGIWLQGPSDKRMYGVQADPADLAPAWGSARTVDQVAQRLTAAAAAG